MFWLAVPAVAIAWLLQYFNTQPLLVVPAPAWAGVALLCWCLLGGRPALVVLIAGWTLCRADWLIETRLPDSLAGHDFVVRGVICDFPRTDAEALRLVLERDAEPQIRHLPARLHLNWYEKPPEIRPGQHWQLRVRLKTPRGLLNPGGFDFEEWLYVRGIGASGYVRASRLNRPLPAAPWVCPVGGARDYLARRIEAAVGAHPGGSYVLGVAVGATFLLTEGDWELLRQTGTTHLLAISGLNIAMVAAPFLMVGPMLGRLWPRLAGRPNAGLLGAVLAAGIYSALSGFALSTVRAFVMLTVAAVLAVRRRRVDGGDLLATAAVAAIVLDPATVVTVSFWLSFLAVAWLFIASAPGERTGHQAAWYAVIWHAFAQAGAGLIRAQVVLGLGLAPISLAWFHQVSLIAPLTNLIAVPVFSIAVMPLTLLGTALVVPMPSAGGALLRLAADVVQQLMSLLSLMAGQRTTVWEPAPAGTLGLFLGLLAALILCWWRPVPHRILGLALLLPMLAGTSPRRPPLRVTAMDVGQGLAVLIETPHHALLYDAGPAFRLRDAGESVVVPVLRRAGIRNLDAVLISHEDQDHRGGAGSVLKQFPGARLIAPADLGLPAAGYQRCEAGLSWEWDGVRFRVISPSRAAGWRSDNDGSCVLRIDAPRASLLLPGDIERPREDHLAWRELLQPVDVVVAPHHGSRSSSGPSFTAATRPRFVIFSAGHLNRWGFPAAEVVARWEQSGACLLNTAVSGALVLEIAATGEWRVARRERVDGAHLWTTGLGDATGRCPGEGARRFGFRLG